ncbi:TPA: hypothetical protein QCY38_003832 [Bacillus toyonensis]|nr:hypothetical protein [Bacillus toyonensis]
MLNIMNLNTDNPPSVAQVCKEIGVSRGFLAKRFPDIIVIISKKYKEAINKKREQSKHLRQEEMRETVLKIWSKSIYPSISVVQKEFEFNTYEVELMNIWRETLIELGIPLRISTRISKSMNSQEV